MASPWTIGRVTLGFGAALALVGGSLLTSASASTPSPTIAFAGSTASLQAAPAGTTKVKWYDDTNGSAAYLGAATLSPWSFPLPSSVHVVEARTVGGDVVRLDSLVSTATASPTPTPTVSPTPTPSPTPTASPTATPSPTPTASPSPTASTTPSGSIGTRWDVTTTTQLDAALASAKPGDTITVAAGTYNHSKGRWEAAASGTPGHPITLTGPGTLTGGGISGNYGLHVTGSWWVITQITVANAAKGIVLDGSNHDLISGVTVTNTGDEGVHFRDCSSDDTLTGSTVENTGLAAPQYGEGAYVGSANSNWGSYNCTDGRDNSERDVISNNTFRNNAAEGADLKEGTDSGTLTGNTFDNSGFSGKNSADSAVDVKGNNWQIANNTVTNPSGSFNDGFQVHNVYAGYGYNNVFRSNHVVGSIPGYGFALYPADGSIVYCGDTAPGAASGLIGQSNQPVACTP